MIVSNDDEMNGERVEPVGNFIYLNSKTESSFSDSAERRHRLAVAKTVLIFLKIIWKSGSISKKTKVKVLTRLVLQTGTYDCESRTLT